jgi:hypothetical protein
MDNFFKQCPAMMSDGRLFTDYRSTTQREENIKYINGINNEDNYRLFLQNNTQTIINREWEVNDKLKSCKNANACIHNYPTRVKPEWFVEELQKYNDRQRMVKYPCAPAKEYRMTN